MNELSYLDILLQYLYDTKVQKEAKNLGNDLSDKINPEECKDYLRLLKQLLADGYVYEDRKDAMPGWNLGSRSFFAISTEGVLLIEGLPIEYLKKPYSYHLKLLDDKRKSESEKEKLILKNLHMPKYFEIEKREIFGDAYLKIHLRADLDPDRIAAFLETLHSIRRANVTKQQSGKVDLTIYRQKAYDISEVEQEINLNLPNYLEGSPFDPTFLEETVSAISDKAYYQVIDYMLRLGNELEKFNELNGKFDEERYRDYFLPFLNSISLDYSAKGEVFNRKGKTDILFFDKEGNNLFIAECKLWKGEAYLISAIDQLLQNYVNWRDEKTAIIIFNRDVKKFTTLIETAIKTVQDHPLCIKALGKRKETSYSFSFKNPNDDKKTIKLELVLFNFA